MKFLKWRKNRKLDLPFDEGAYDLKDYEQDAIEPWINKVQQGCSRSTLLDLGDRYLDFRKFGPAKDCYQFALKYDEEGVGNEDVYLALSHLFTLKEDYQKAAAEISKAVENMGSVSEKLFKLAEVLYKLEELDGIKSHSDELKDEFIKGYIKEVMDVDIQKGTALEQISEILPDSENGKKVRLLETALDCYKTAKSTLRYGFFEHLEEEEYLRDEIEGYEREVLCNLCKISPTWYKACDRSIYPREPKTGNMALIIE